MLPTLPRLPVRRLKSVVFPQFGLPTSAMRWERWEPGELGEGGELAGTWQNSGLAAGPTIPLLVDLV